jgi:hypothetical protein
MKKMKIEDVS